MKVGIDLVRVSRMKSLMQNKEAIEKLFHPSETSDNPENLAGKFAVKEAYFKAKGKKGSWLDIEISHDNNGRPLLYSDKDENITASITHEDGYAAAVVVIE